ncbi:MAG TPA: tetratricopeptide repeat protein [Vicinamibacteria bacterium]|nr:tetratricopeptide repeat protein [Vicinamibacteria bacterium]
MSTRKPAPTVDRRSQQALDVFEKAMKALGKHDYEKARAHFDQLVESFPEERDMVERARTHRAMCDRAADKKGGGRPKTFDDFLHQGVFLHNRGDYEAALKLLRQAAEMSPRNEDAHYCLAATAARSGDADTALKSLKAAVALSPDARAQARLDPDFEALRDDDSFLEILQGE